MDIDNEAKNQAKKIIRETMEWKETDELMSIWKNHDTSDWTEDAIEVAGEILQERGEDLDFSRDEEEIIVSKEKPSEHQDPFAPYWRKESLYPLPFEDKFVPLPADQPYVRQSAEDGENSLICIFCESKVPQGARFCPYCGNALYSEETNETGDDSEEDENLFAELDNLSSDELDSEFEQINFNEMSRSEALAWRHAYRKYNRTPIGLFDKGEVLQRFYPFLSDEAIYLPGFPGYRTLPGKLGLDYVETRAEIGHVCGIYLGQLIRFDLRSDNLFAIIFLFLSGVVCLLPIIDAAKTYNYDIFFSDYPWNTWINFSGKCNPMSI